MILRFGILFVFVISACSEVSLNSPGEQCLSSFRHRLKDPTSGKVISFQQRSSVSGTVTYTAKNSFGANIQESEACLLESSKWVSVGELISEKARREGSKSSASQLHRPECLRLAHQAGADPSQCN